MTKLNQFITSIVLIAIFAPLSFANEINENSDAEAANNQPEEQVVEVVEIFDCSESCFRRCEKKELVPHSCENNSCKCGPERL